MATKTGAVVVRPVARSPTTLDIVETWVSSLRELDAVPPGDHDSEVGLESICAAVLVAEAGSTFVQGCSGGPIA